MCCKLRFVFLMTRAAYGSSKLATKSEQSSTPEYCFLKTSRRAETFCDVARTTSCHLPYIGMEHSFSIIFASGRETTLKLICERPFVTDTFELIVLPLDAELLPEVDAG